MADHKAPKSVSKVDLKAGKQSVDDSYDVHTKPGSIANIK